MTPRAKSVGLKLAVSNFVLVALVLSALIFAIVYSVSNLVESRATEDVTEKTKMLVNLIDSSDKDLRRRTEILAKGFLFNLSGNFELDTETVDTGGKPAPGLKLDGNLLNGEATLVDRFTSSTGAVATVFAKTGDDFIRVTTSLKNLKGERVIGTLLDRKHPGYEAVLGGRSHIGLATLFGKRYMTQYNPIKDASGKIVGLSFVGLDFTDFLENLKT
jgi:methyl-accepting chemotaxis protein